MFTNRNALEYIVQLLNVNKIPSHIMQNGGHKLYKVSQNPGT